MADIQKALADIMKSVDDVKSMEKSLSQLKDLKLNADIQTDLKALRVIERMEAQVRSLMKAKQELSQAEAEEKQAREEAAKSGGKISDEQKKKFDEASKREAKYRREVVQTAKDQIDMQNKLQAQQIEEQELIMQRWKSNTMLGKSYAAVTGKVAEYGVKLGFAALSIKALVRFTDAARLRNDLLIASYKGLQDDGFWKTAGSVMDYEKAIRGANATAIRLGMSNEDTTAIMMKFQGIVGEDTPEALGSLTSAALAVSKVMGITTAQTMDYVSARIENFGGTAADALKSLYDLGSQTEKYNKTMDGVRIKGDDVVRTINDITNSNSVYAVDQRYIAGLLMRTSANLQTQGESYNFAQRSAENYSKALTSEAPEWMQITNAMDLTKVVKQNMDKQGNLNAEFIARLEKAKPGLSKKVKEIMNSTVYNSYDKARLIGETLKDTELGMSLMSKKIAKLGASSISILVHQFGKTYLEAEAMYKTAVKEQEIDKHMAALNNKETADDYMKNVLKMSEEERKIAKVDAGYKRKIVEDFVAEKTKLEAAAAKKAYNKGLQEQVDLKEKSIKIIEENIGKMSGESKERAEAELESLKSERDNLLSQIQKENRTGVLGVVDKITDTIKEKMKLTSLFSGDLFKSIGEQLSSPLVLAAGGLAVTFVKGFKPLDRIEKSVYQILLRMGGGGGGEPMDPGSTGGRKGLPRRGRFRDRLKNFNKLRKGKGLVTASKYLASGAMGSARSMLGSAVGGIKGMGGGLKGLAKKGLGSFGKLLDVGTTAMAAKDAYAQGGFKGMAKSLAPTAGGLAGGTAGAAIGGALGTMLFPGVGTAIGAFGGRMLGDYLGSMATERFTDSMVAPTRAADTMTPTPVSTGTPTVMAPGSGPQGSLGTLNPDGSITMTITNFMGAFAEANTTARSRTIRRS